MKEERGIDGNKRGSVETKPKERARAKGEREERETLSDENHQPQQQSAQRAEVAKQTRSIYTVFL